ncbi:Nramp family divalent metal transporter [Rhodobacter capsulatus]
MLLDGPPGIGKSTWARHLATALRVPPLVIEATTENASFGVLGCQRGWATAGPGRLLQLILQERVGNPIVVIDELEKAGRVTGTNGGAYDLCGGLLPLLEPMTASRWTCPYFQVPFDLGQVSWVMTVNDARHLPAPLMSRCPPIRLPHLTTPDLTGFAGRHGARRGLSEVGIIGATVMPHAIFLHSGLTQNRAILGNDSDRRRMVRISNIEVVVALAGAGLINMAMVMMAASAFHNGHAEVAEIETAYHTLTPLLGGFAASAFLLSLIASGISSSVVCTMAGQMIMQGFLRVNLPLWLRRAVTMVPAFVVVASGANATDALVMSQVVLSIALPVPMLALLWLIRKPEVMGAFVPARKVQAAAALGACLVLSLNMVLLLGAFGIEMPFLS